MYFTEYEISLMPEGDQQVMYYEPDSHTQQYSTMRPGRRGQLGEDGQTTGLQPGETNKQRHHHGLLSSGSSNKGGLLSWLLILALVDTLTHLL